MSVIRIKHDDPTARISYAVSSEPDEKGGFLVEEKHVAASLDHGWRVVHMEYDEEDTKDRGDQSAAAPPVRPRMAEVKLEKAEKKVPWAKPVADTEKKGGKELPDTKESA